MKFSAKCDPNKQSNDESLSQNISQKNREFCDNKRKSDLMTRQQNQTKVTLQLSVNNNGRFDDGSDFSHTNVQKTKANQQSKLPSISEHEILSPAPSISSVSSSMTQSSISSNSYSINSSSSSYSCSSGTTNITNTAYINQNTHTMTSGFIPPYNNMILPAIINIAPNTSYLGIPFTATSCLSIPPYLMLSTQPFPIQPVQFNQSTVMNSCISTIQPRDDINTQCNNNTTNQMFEHTEHGGNEEKKTSTSTCFEPKLSNPAKGNFYISKPLVSQMMDECMEQFETDHINDEKLAFAYYKESVAVQINDKQINIISTEKGLIILINIDLHFGTNENTMYLVATENDIKFREKVRWKIIDFMDEDKIYDEYRISSNQLPRSSRDMNWFKCSMNNPPINIAKDTIYNTNFKKIPGKISKRTKTVLRTKITERELINCCFKSWNNGIMIPVIVIKEKKQWVEWKKLIKINDNNNQWIGISLRYYACNKQWKIQCLEYDIGRIFYQHRLCGLNRNDKHYYSYTNLSKYNIIALDIINDDTNL